MVKLIIDSTLLYLFISEPDHKLLRLAEYTYLLTKRHRNFHEVVFIVYNFCSVFSESCCNFIYFILLLVLLLPMECPPCEIT